ncbi:MAG: substrate-binding domain-containing protein [Eubacteriales bacterium]|nr:substrate-binding domain-containing protein [Eubacteriales bacterium]
MKKLLACLMAATLIFSGCGANKGGESADTGEKGGEKVIALSMNTLSNPFFVSVVEGCKAEAAEQGYEVIVTDAQDNPTTQQKDIENLITKKPAAILIDPCDSDAIISSVEACNAANIPVFTMDRRANGGEVIAHVGYDAVKSGNLAGEFLAKSLGGKGKVVELQGILGSNVAQERSKGFNEIMDKNPDIEIVARQTANFNRTEGLSVMENILQGNPEIDGIYCANDEMLLGALEAVNAAGRKDKIVMIGCDALDETIDAIKNGKVEATIAEPPFVLGRGIMNTAVKHLKGEKVEKDVVLKNKVLTKENVDSFDPKKPNE